MADQLQLRGGSTAQTATFTGALREVTVDTDKKTVVVHDGTTAGGNPLLRQDLSNLPAGTIDNADINASAAIALTKLGTGALPTTVTVASANLVDGTIVNADINTSAAIAGTKVSPNFGSQNIITTGDAQAASLNGGPLAGMRNAIINGAMVIDQRNGGVSVSSGVGVTTYTVDRWSVAATGAAVTVQRQGTATNYWLNITGAASNTAVNIRQRLEALNIATLASASVTLSFDCSSTTATTLGISVSCASASDNFATVTNTQSFTRTITSTGTRYSASLTLPSQAVNGVEVTLSLTNFTSGTFALSKVQLEPGSVATPFEQRSFGQELALCQRYYEAGKHSIGGYAAAAAAQPTSSIGFAVTKIATPTVTIDGLDQLVNATSVSSDALSISSFRAVASATATGHVFVRGNYIAAIEL